MGQRRVFCALMLGAALGQRWEHAAEQALRPAAPGALRGLRQPFALVRAADLHLTLAFAGALDVVAAERFAAALARAFSGAESPRLVLAGTDAFPNRRRARVLVVRASEPLGTRLADLATRASSAAAEAGVELPDAAGAGGAARPFAPHVTLARIRERRPGQPHPVPEAFYALDLALPWQPSAAAWVESPGGGAPYRVVAEFPLAARPA